MPSGVSVKKIRESLRRSSGNQNLDNEEENNGSSSLSKKKVIINLKILRGIELIAMDSNITTKNSSDPYCDIYVDGIGKVGRTPTQTQTLNPIWGGPMSSFKFAGENKTRLRIELFDMDTLKSDDPMGQVEFNVGDVIRQMRNGYPNAWFPVMPSEGCPNPTGMLELRLSYAQNAPAKRIPPSSLVKSASADLDRTSTHAEYDEDDSNDGYGDYGGLDDTAHLSGGPKYKGKSYQKLRTLILTSTTPVTLHVYDVGHDDRIRRVNTAGHATGAGGIFHAAVEVYGKEYSYGGSKLPRSGVFQCRPRKCPMHTYRKSLFLGDCELRRDEVQKILRKMEPEWMGPSYDIFRKNCCFFAKEFAIELGVGSIPEWVYTLANVGAKVEEYYKAREAKKLKRKKKKEDKKKRKKEEKKRLSSSSLQKKPDPPTLASVISDDSEDTDDDDDEHEHDDERDDATLKRIVDNTTLDDVMASKVQTAFRNSVAQHKKSPIIIERKNRRSVMKKMKHVVATRNASVGQDNGEGVEIEPL